MEIRSVGRGANPKLLEAEFRFERDMIPIARNWMSDQGLMSKVEFYTPWGVCDLVGVSLEESRVQDRLNLGQKQAVGPLIRVEILNRVPDIETGTSITIDSLEYLYRELLTPEELRFQLNHLRTGKFVLVNEQGAFQKLNGWAPMHKRIVALELKLTRVEEALSQAVSHLEFVQESFVGLPVKLAERVANSNRVREFRRLGVGIVSVGAEKCVVLLSSIPPHAVANRVMQMHCVERFWRTRPRDNGA